MLQVLTVSVVRSMLQLFTGKINVTVIYRVVRSMLHLFTGKINVTVIFHVH